MKKIFKYLSLVIITAIITISFSSYAKRDKAKYSEDQYYQLFRKLINITKKNYVETVDEKKLFYAAFDGMLSSLDPHSGFLNPEDFKEITVQTRGEFGGVGIEITMGKGFLKVVSPIDDTPAFKAGIKPLDYITMINDESVRDLNINQAVQKIRGPKGTKVKLTVIREGAGKPLEVTLVRSTIKINSVKSKILANDIGYFRVTTFSQNTTIALESQFKKIKNKLKGNLKGIVLDLRNNPGGLLDQAIGVSELFLDGKIVVSTKGRNRNSVEIFSAAPGDISNKKPIVVLINQGSASASEIVAGAMQDHKRGVVLGAKSFGKGSVQTLMPISKDLGIRLTTSRYYTPQGHSIQAKGITPDILVEQSKIDTEDRKYLSESNLRGHLSKKDSKKKKNDQASKLKKLYDTDYQLGRAVDLLHAISVIQ
jgi:carboxyl-terminal processing protease